MDATPEISGLSYDGAGLTLNPNYPAKETLTANQDVVNSERVLFDKAFITCTTTPARLRKSCGRIGPTNSSWRATCTPILSRGFRAPTTQTTEPPYFTRGGEVDFDNGAIWQGTMFKHRAKYYMYYENHHNIDQVDQPYEAYDHIHSGSRVGYATAN